MTRPVGRFIISFALTMVGLMLCAPTIIWAVLFGRLPSDPDEWVMLGTGLFLLILNLIIPDRVESDR